MRRALPAFVLMAVLTAATAQGVPVPPPSTPPAALSANNALVLEAVSAEARALAKRPYQAPAEDLPAALAELDQATYRAIGFRAEQALWRGERLFEAQFHHRGFVYRHPVRIHEVVDGRIRKVPFAPERFRYDGDAAGLGDAAPADLGYAGLRLHFPINHPERKEAVLDFLGASYFRVLARGQAPGLSARGLAVDTALPGGEEFPRFTDFWLLRPSPEAAAMTVIALLDSPSVTGAYRFDVCPGARTHVEVTAHLFARSEIGKLGIGPLTSMFLHGENTTRAVDDVRPEVHDSDGLLLQTAAGERIWRPLVNRPHLRISALQADALPGFGLLQRDRSPTRYLDTRTAFHRHPSYWVTPLGEGWEAGSVELIEIPTLREINDNIVAYWRPEAPLSAGESRTYRYRLTAFGDEPADRLGRVQRTRVGWAGNGSDEEPPRTHRRFLVDFRGGDLDGLAPEQPVRAELTGSSGETRELRVTAVPESGVWRASFSLVPGSGAADLRLRLLLRGEPVTETWNYVWYPEERP